jgi:hypothetical protein
MFSKPHPTIKIAIEARFTRRRLLPDRLRGSLLLDGFTEMWLIFTLVELLRNLELWLKKRVKGQLTKLRGNDWWSALPPGVRDSARRRCIWASRQLGSRRAGKAESIHWLSFGDLLKVLASFDERNWVDALIAEQGRQKQLDRVCLVIKAFRDNELAHPKPRRATTPAVERLLRAIEGVPSVVVPCEWRMFEELSARVAALPRHVRLELLDSADPHFETDQQYATKLMMCAELCFNAECHHASASARVVSWRVAVLGLVAVADTRGEFVFSSSPAA